MGSTHQTAEVSARTESRRTRVLRTVTLLLVLSASFNVLLARRVTRLTDNLHLVRSEQQLAIGASVPSIAVRDLDGGRFVIEYPPNGVTTILYIFTPQCGWCTKNIPNIKALAGQVRGQYRFVGLSLSSDQLREYVVHQQPNFQVYGDIAPTAVAAYRLSATPQTIVVSPEARVLKVWNGAYDGDLLGEIATYFHARLPGVTEEKEKTADQRPCDDCDENAKSH